MQIVLSKCNRMFAMQADSPGGVGGEVSLPLAKVVPMVNAASEEVVAEAKLIVEYEVSKLPEVVRACADAFSAHVSR